jgi:hypothetical protein
LCGSAFSHEPYLKLSRFTIVWVLLVLAAQAAAAVDFNRDIEPILADNCYACHGPDPGGRKAGLRLDIPDVAFRKLKDGAVAVVPRQSAASEVIRRVTSSDPDKHMPPSGHDAISAAQIQTLKTWIDQGAPYRKHWSFEKPVRAALPVVKDASWPKGAIDRFILANLEAHSLHPSPPATKYEIARRVSLDLTGLLPTPSEVDAFVNDTRPDAYERLVDRLLASPRFGEHRARYWLDYVRYGDTHGLHNDNQRDIWPYRDYVIRSFNANKPFDRFAIEQIAGDLLPGRNVDQLIATGYVRCNLSTGEGGAINEEILCSNNRDRVENYGSVFLGLTLGCAVCHDHKFDPTTQKDFYQLTAFFSNLNERPGNDDLFDLPPTLRIPKPEHLAEYDAVLQKASSLRHVLREREKQSDPIADWIDFGPAPKAVSTRDLQMRLRLDEGAGDVVKNSAPNARSLTHAITDASPVWSEQVWLWPSMRMQAQSKLSAPDVGDFDLDEPFSAGCWAQVRWNPAQIGDVNSAALMSRMDSKQKDCGWDLYDDAGKIVVELVNDWPNNAIKVQTTAAAFTKGSWHHAFFTYDGSGKAAGVRIFVDGKRQPMQIVKDTLSKSIRTKVPWELGRRHDSDVMKLARFQDVRVYARALNDDEAACVPREDYAAELYAIPSERWNADQRHAATQFYFDRVDDLSARLRQELAALNTKLEALAKDGDQTMVAADSENLPLAYVLTRGVYTARAQRVTADVPAFLHGSHSVEANRLGLARWTVSDDNPLTARVIVNRMWQELFGVGLVETTGDFGMMGSRPSNPDLLDWLAVEFRESGWDVKHMYRLIVTSAAYQQSAIETPQLLDADPQNRWLTRGPRFRMDGEMLRDAALQASGLLVDQIGGPGAKPYQPPGIWEAVRGLATRPQTWIQDHGMGTYRRSVYTYWKRQAPPPDMLALDAPMRDVACTRRERTNTPLQALVLWNDPQWVEAGRMLAARAIDAEKSDCDRLNFMARSVLCRPLDDDETAIFLASLKEFRTKFEANPKSAEALAGVGDAKGPTSPEAAAWSMVAIQIFNTDEALNK